MWKDRIDPVLKNIYARGPWVAHFDRHLTLDVGSGGDLRIVRLTPMLGSTFSAESA